jgi:N-acetyl-anhydromuramoyl-L-alanine amidase
VSRPRRAAAAPAPVDAEGWLRGARRVPSPNFDARPSGTAIELLVVHHISLPPGRFSGDAVERLFTNCLDCTAHPYFARLDGLRVSAHFLVRRRGELLQFVSCDARAWHAGESALLGRPRCNDYSIGIELEGDGERRFTDAQYRVLARTVRALRGRYPLRHVAGHSDVAPGRKVDPGPRFDWARFEESLGAQGPRRPFDAESRDAL